jgi:hypothetical protein
MFNQFSRVIKKKCVEPRIASFSNEKEDLSSGYTLFFSNECIFFVLGKWLARKIRRFYKSRVNEEI